MGSNLDDNETGKHVKVGSSERRGSNDIDENIQKTIMEKGKKVRCWEPTFVLVYMYLVFACVSNPRVHVFHVLLVPIPPLLFIFHFHVSFTKQAVFVGVLAVI